METWKEEENPKQHFWNCLVDLEKFEGSRNNKPTN